MKRVRSVMECVYSLPGNCVCVHYLCMCVCAGERVGCAGQMKVAVPGDHRYRETRGGDGWLISPEPFLLSKVLLFFSPGLIEVPALICRWSL